MPTERMTRSHVLRQLLRLGALAFGELRTYTGWSELRLKRGLEVACSPRGPLARDWLDGRWIYRVKTDDELRRLPARKKRSRRVSPLRSRMPHLRGAVSVAPAAQSWHPGGAAGAAAQDTGGLDGDGACGAAAARAGEAGLETVGAPWQ